MKFKRHLLMLALSATMLFSMATVVYAASYAKETVKSTHTSLSIEGKMDYKDPWCWFASIEYSAELKGTTDDILKYCKNEQVYVKAQAEYATQAEYYFAWNKLKTSGSKSATFADKDNLCNYSELILRKWDID